MPVVGFLNQESAEMVSHLVTGFRKGLSETGFAEGQNVAIEYRWAEGRYERLPALAADLVSAKIDVLVASGPQGPRAARNATATIPIVFVTGADPVGDGLVRSLARPGSNLTGVSIQIAELVSKRLELLSELVPHAKVIALLMSPTESEAIGHVQAAAHTKGVE